MFYSQRRYHKKSVLTIESDIEGLAGLYLLFAMPFFGICMPSFFVVPMDLFGDDFPKPPAYAAGASSDGHHACDSVIK